MKIIVCFKVAQDLESVMKRDWENASLQNFDINYTKKELNCYDEAALEAALRLKDSYDKTGREIIVDAVTVGNGNYDLFYKNLFAVGVNAIYQIHTDKELTWNPYTVAALLAEKVKGYDAVLTGCRNAMGDNGLTPFALAKALGCPCINHVISLHAEDNGLRVAYERDQGERHATVRIPAVYAFGNSDSPYLRVATLREKLAVKGKQAEHLNRTAEETEKYRATNLCHEEAMKECRFIEGETPEEKAKLLLEELRKEKLA